MIDLARPFVLLEDHRPGGGPARLYRDPPGIIAANTIAQVLPALEAMRSAAAEGLHLAGFITYEAGFAFEPRLASYARQRDSGGPLLWFGTFAEVGLLDGETAAALLPNAAGAHRGAPRPLIGREAHAEGVARIQALIADGDVYQANLTFPAAVPIAGDPLALYAGLRGARAGWGGVVFTGERWLLSASPELFFTLEDRRLTARPMKGTAARGADRAADEAAAAALARDPKERAENLMIVDLLRNDLARIAAAGSVAVPALFGIETYPTVHQMTSTVTARLAAGRDAIDVLRATFPCGSVTGAPKVRAMEVIAGIERAPRNSYTGSIGYIGPDGEAAFNVAIRTLEVDGDGRAIVGLGSGIVADSRAADEWRECLAKGLFVTDGQRRFDLIETMRFDAIEGIAELDRHLARMSASADALGFAFDRHGARNELQAATFRLNAAATVRLLLAVGGGVAIEVRPLPVAPQAPVDVALAPLPVASADFRLRHKTSDRGFYDAARARAGSFEVLFVDKQGFLTEGSFTSLFVPRGERLLTPPLSRGLLPGVLRARLIGEGRAIEAELVPADLADGFLIGNARRGLIAARLVAAAADRGL